MTKVKVIFTQFVAGVLVFAGLQAVRGEALTSVAPLPGAWGDWQAWGDMGDGTYRNPMLPADQYNSKEKCYENNC